MSTIEIEIQSEELRRAMTRLQESTQNMRPLMENIGAALSSSISLRFRDSVAPDGSSWKPLSDVTLALRRGSSAKILRDSGILAASITANASPNQVEVGTGLEYAKTHQFGAKKGQFGVFTTKVKAHTRKGRPVREYDRKQAIPWGDIPARPFIGFSTEDEDEISRLIAEHLAL